MKRIIVRSIIILFVFYLIGCANYHVSGSYNQAYNLDLSDAIPAFISPYKFNKGYGYENISTIRATGDVSDFVKESLQREKANVKFVDDPEKAKLKVQIKNFKYENMGWRIGGIIYAEIDNHPIEAHGYIKPELWIVTAKTLMNGVRAPSDVLAKAIINYIKEGDIPSYMEGNLQE